MDKFVGLCILDGLGLSDKKENNAFYLAKTPCLDSLYKRFSHTVLEASGEKVGLPQGQMGNSEVGHLNLGAGRIVYQDLTKINKSILDQSFFSNEAFLKIINHVQKAKSKLHLMGLFSDGGVHSHLDHLRALLKLIKIHRLEKKTYLHIFTDGRDTAPCSSIQYLEQLKDDGFQIASVSGRYYALDRDNNWDRLNLVYNALVTGKAPIFNNALEGIKKSHQEGVTDEFIKPFITNLQGLVEDHDGIIFTNFRSDRAIRLAVAFSNPQKTFDFVSPGKDSFKGEKIIQNLLLVTMTKYSNNVKSLVAYEKDNLKNIYGEVIAKQGLNQLRIAETEKYPHVTFFFNGGKEQQLERTEYILIPSPKVPTYDLKPEMSAQEITNKAKEAILSKKYQTMILNFANPDMVGHTGSLEATIKAVETVDQCLQELVETVLKINGVLCIVADHGNAEQMTDEIGNPFTAHTSNLVPFIVTIPHLNLRSNGCLSDVAPTMLELLAIPQPLEMSGKSLILRKK